MGSKLANLIGAKRYVTDLEKRLTWAQHHGVTRLEISICRDALQEYKPHHSRVGKIFDQKVGMAFKSLLDGVLNDAKLLRLAYRRLQLGRLVKRIGSCDENLLVIGRANSWLINCKAL